MKFQKPSLAWIGMFLLWVVYFSVMLMIYLTHRHGAGDFIAYYKASVAVTQHKLMYIDLYASKPYLYPPLLSQLFAPAITLTSNFRDASIIWYLLNVGALVVGTGLLASQVITRRGKLIVWLMPLLYLAVFFNYLLGQVSVLIFTLVVAGWAAYRNDKPGWAGALLATAAWIKVYPALLIIYFIYKRDWRVLKAVMFASVGIVAFQIIVSGVDNFVYYFTDVLPTLAAEGQAGLSHASHSILSLAQKMFVPTVYVIPLVNNPALVSPVRWALTAIVCGVFVYLTTSPWRSWRETERKVFDLEYAMVTMLSLLLGGTLGLHGMVTLLLVVVILLQNTPPHLLLRVSMRLFLALALINVHLLIMMGYTGEGSDPVPALWFMTPSFGMLILFLQNAVYLNRYKTAKATPAVMTPSQSYQMP